MIPLLIGLLLPGFWYAPFHGDLTRIGNLSEKDYGWQIAQKYYPNLLFKRNSNKYTSYSDVLIIGDSFSMPNRIIKPNKHGKYIYWTNEFANKTGLSISAIHIDSLSIDKLVSSEAFQLYPPKIVIYQSVERGIKGRLKQSSKKTCNNLFIPNTNAISVKSMNILSRDYKLIKKNFWLDYETNIYVARHKIKDIFNIPKVNKVKIIPLKSAAPFSSKEKKKLLIVEADFKKEELTQQRLNDMQCTLLTFQNKIQKNGHTSFFAMIAPDKLSLYAHLANDKNLVHKSLFEKLELNDDINWIKVGTELKTAIENGQIDIYRPNDTHWGSAGGELVSSKIIRHLQSKGIINHQ